MTFVRSEVWTDGFGLLRRRKRCGFLIGQPTAHEGGRDVGDLVSVDKAGTVLRLDDDSVEQVLGGNLQDVLDGSELVPGGTDDG